MLKSESDSMSQSNCHSDDLCTLSNFSHFRNRGCGTFIASCIELVPLTKRQINKLTNRDSSCVILELCHSHFAHILFYSIFVFLVMLVLILYILIAIVCEFVS